MDIQVRIEKAFVNDLLQQQVITRSPLTEEEWYNLIEHNEDLFNSWVDYFMTGD